MNVNVKAYFIFIQNLSTVALAIPEICLLPSKLKMGHVKGSLSSVD